MALDDDLVFGKPGWLPEWLVMVLRNEGEGCEWNLGCLWRCYAGLDGCGISVGGLGMNVGDV